MSDEDKFPEEIDAFLNDVWGKRAEGLPVATVDWERPIRHEDTQYLMEYHYPYLQILSTEPEFPEVIVPKFYRAESGWDIHDYGPAMSVSPGKYLYGPGNPEIEEEDEGGEGGAVPEGRGTIVKQINDTAYAMIQLAIEKGWPGVEIIAGTGLMKWAAWMAAEDNGLSLQGYEPSEKEKSKRERIKKALTETEQAARPKKGLGR